MSRSPSPSRSVRTAEYVRSGVGPRSDARKLPLPSLRRMRSSNGVWRPLARTTIRIAVAIKIPNADVGGVFRRLFKVENAREARQRGLKDYCHRGRQQNSQWASEHVNLR